MRRLFRAAAAFAAVVLTACGPRLPAGVDADKLQEAVSDAVGDPNTCVLLGRQGSGEVVWRYNTHTTCARSLPSCEGAASRTVGDLLKAEAADGRARMLSCASVGWAAGAAGHGLVYAAVMEGSRAMPGRVMADKLDGALKDAGL
jgi:hypothetical protein